MPKADDTGLWRRRDPEGYRKFWQTSHWDVLSVFIHQREAVLLDQAVLCSLLATSKDVRAAILEGSCRGQACIRFEAKSDLKRVRRLSLWLQGHAKVVRELELLLGQGWATLADLQTAEASVAAGLHTAAAQQSLAVQAYSCKPATPSMQLALLQHLGSSLSSVSFTCHDWVCGGDAPSAGFKARWRGVLGQPAAAAAALGRLRSLEVHQSYKCGSNVAGRLQLSALSQLTALRLTGPGEVAAGNMQQLPSTLQELQVALCEGSQQLNLAHLSALTQLQLRAAKLAAYPDRAAPGLQLQNVPSPPNLAAEAAAWPGLPLRQLSLHGLSVPVAVLQRLAELPGGVRSLELNFCEFGCTPRQVAKVLKRMYKLRELKMRRLFHAPASCSLMAGTRELMRTLGCIHLHTLEVDDMPLGNFVQELAAETDRWLERQLPLQRLVLSNCNLNNRATYAVLKACRNCSRDCMMQA
ncbi:hypothetical protein OEZ85_004351 [Tetradesmus obliquus]|uniref:Uncharacterized protein n=1 Tax=Tetradesmus obliquus TaxID=3088 RepID=A0ABY8UKG0_TETOB|nr:hypothetical protein OEZ85_004351 [Tetradesmus obliquus]